MPFPGEITQFERWTVGVAAYSPRSQLPSPIIPSSAAVSRSYKKFFITPFSRSGIFLLRTPSSSHGRIWLPATAPSSYMLKRSSATFFPCCCTHWLIPFRFQSPENDGSNTPKISRNASGEKITSYLPAPEALRDILGVLEPSF